MKKWYLVIETPEVGRTIRLKATTKVDAKAEALKVLNATVYDYGRKMGIVRAYAHTGYIDKWYGEIPDPAIYHYTNLSVSDDGEYAARWSDEPEKLFDPANYW